MCRKTEIVSSHNEKSKIKLTQDILGSNLSPEAKTDLVRFLWDEDYVIKIFNDDED